MAMNETQAIVIDDSDEERDQCDPKKQVAVLRILAQKGYPQTDLPVYEGQNIIGRHADDVATTHNVLCIPFVSISKTHAVIDIEKGLHLIRDNYSRNTTRRGEVKLKPNVQYELSDGCTLYFADIECQYILKDIGSDDGSETESESMLVIDRVLGQNVRNVNSMPGISSNAAAVSGGRASPGTLEHVTDSEDEESPVSRVTANTDKKSVSGTNISVVQETPVLSRTVAKGGDVSLISETVMYASDQDDDDVRSLDDSNISKPPLPAAENNALVSETVRYESDNDDEDSETGVPAAAAAATKASNQQAAADAYDCATQLYVNYNDEASNSNSSSSSYKSYDAPTQTYKELHLATKTATTQSGNHERVETTHKVTRLSSAATSMTDWLNTATQLAVPDSRQSDTTAYDDTTDEEVMDEDGRKITNTVSTKTTDSRFDEPTQAFLPRSEIALSAKHVAPMSAGGTGSKKGTHSDIADSTFNEPTQVFSLSDVTPTKHTARMSAGGGHLKAETTASSTFDEPTQALLPISPGNERNSGSKHTARMSTGGDRATLTPRKSKDSRNIFEVATQNFMDIDIATPRNSNSISSKPSTVYDEPTQLMQLDEDADHTVGDKHNDATQVIGDDKFAMALKIVATSGGTIFDEPTQAMLPSASDFVTKPIASQSSSTASTQLVESSPKKAQLDKLAKIFKSSQSTEKMSKKTANATVNHDMGNGNIPQNDYNAVANDKDESADEGAKESAKKGAMKREGKRGTSSRGRGRGRGKAAVLQSDNSTEAANNKDNHTVEQNGDEFVTNKETMNDAAKGRGSRGKKRGGLGRGRVKGNQQKKQKGLGDAEGSPEVDSREGRDSIDLQPVGADKQDDFQLLATQAYAHTTPVKRGRGRGRGKKASASFTPEIRNNDCFNAVSEEKEKDNENLEDDLFLNGYEDHLLATQAYVLQSPAKDDRGSRGGKTRGRGRGRPRGRGKNRSITCSMSEEEDTVGIATAAKDATKKTVDDEGEAEVSASTTKRSAMKQVTPDSKANETGMTVKKRVSYNMPASSSESTEDESSDFVVKFSTPTSKKSGAVKKNASRLESDTESDSEIKKFVVLSPVQGKSKPLAGIAANLTKTTVSVVLNRIASPVAATSTINAKKQQKTTVMSDNDTHSMDNNNNSQNASTADTANTADDSKVAGTSNSVQNEINTPPAAAKRGRKKKSDSGSGQVNDSGVPNKRRNVDTATARIMCTIIDLTSADERALANIGALSTSSVFDCTHLVTDKVRRTSKFLSALAAGIPIVDKSWIVACKKAGKIVDATPFIIHDEENEARYQFSLAASLEQARKEKMLDGWSVYFTSNVQPNRDIFADVVTCSGGQVLTKLPARSSGHVVVVSCEQDRAECAVALKAGIPVVSSELLLTGVLQQQRDIAKYQLFASGSASSSPVANASSSKVSATAAWPKAN